MIYIDPLKVTEALAGLPGAEVLQGKAAVIAYRKGEKMAFWSDCFGRRPVEFMKTKELMRRWRPGSYDDPGWNWRNEWNDINKKDSSSDLRKLIEDIASRGVVNPVVLGHDGRIWDGHHRVCITHELGIEEIPVQYGHHGRD